MNTQDFNIIPVTCLFGHIDLKCHSIWNESFHVGILFGPVFEHIDCPFEILMKIQVLNNRIMGRRVHVFPAPL